MPPQDRRISISKAILRHRRPMESSIQEMTKTPKGASASREHNSVRVSLPLRQEMQQGHLLEATTHLHGTEAEAKEQPQED